LRAELRHGDGRTSLSSSSLRPASSERFVADGVGRL